MSTIQAIIINPDSNAKLVELDQDDYRALEDAVGGFFERVSSATGDTSLWVNEEGKMLGLPINPPATTLWYHLNPVFRQQDFQDFLCGTVVVTGGADDQGRTLSVGPEAIDAMSNLSSLFPGFEK